MKIGIFTETYRPTINGVVMSVDTFREELERRGHHYTILAPAHPDQKRQASIYRFPSLPIPGNLVYPLAFFLPWNWAQRYLPIDRIKQLDIIHIQHFSAMGQYGLACGKLFKIPVIYTYHTMAELYTSYAPIFGPLLRPLVRWWTRYTAARADHIVVPTPSIKAYLRSIGVTQPISVIPTGINTSLFQRTPKVYLEMRYGIPKDRDILLFTGRLAAEKNVRFLLDAFRQVLLACPNAHLILVGGGQDEQRFRELVKRWGIDSHVTFTGFQDHAETIKLFGAADLFTFPSITDTQGIVIIEAMAAGAVPVAIDRLGPHDIITNRQTGRLVELNLEAFSGTIIDLLHHEAKRQAMAKAARQAAKQYDTVKTAAAMEKLYEKITHHSRSTTGS